jgi:inosine/xanthosine triphosphate pyrophosphatase family protein
MHIITGNQGKLKEYRAFFPDIQPLELDLAEIQELDEQKIQHFKIQEALKHIDGDFLIDDVSF